MAMNGIPPAALDERLVCKQRFESHRGFLLARGSLLVDLLLLATAVEVRRSPGRCLRRKLIAGEPSRKS